VPVHHRRSTAGRHPKANGEQRTAGLCAGGKHGDLVGAQSQYFRVSVFDR
jgi:hypothetical protein